MRHKYLFIHSAKALTAGTLFVTLWIGDSARGRRLVQFYQALNEHPDFFFRRWSTDVDNFLTQVEDSIYPGARRAGNLLRQVVLDARHLRRLLLVGISRPGRHHIPGAEVAAALRRRLAALRTCQPGHEENLSHQAQGISPAQADADELLRALAGFAGILLIILLDVLLTNLMY